MHDNYSHPLLEQVPLTVSPFINLPTATTLPYTYKTMPSTLPPSTTGITSTSAGPGADSSGSGVHPSAGPTPSNKAKYVISASGHAAHPDDIVASCRALQAHVARLQADAEAELRALDARIRARDLAERRRVAPGWLDSEARLLEPERKASAAEELPPATEAGAGDFGGPPGYAGGGQLFAGQHVWGSGHGPGGESEMAVPDEGEQLDRVFGGLALGK
ncbi:hypothetical protein QBC33DRAFT_516133 [Phialemonium atrogriseum]|uniref:Uncharacterized protein n=1 Tax=Phialemonium atrogriseum TaxID=1093897 RepID=A0AAJ0BYJ2_9PEZI|nr:uncharacterized protein QBC33DRAFT_516133 [Phialemonium atrogriseum]KAK1766232.1 hypothetical protein QBC33DRAFT_516133 [Phialemonium atrogriseum]